MHYTAIILGIFLCAMCGVSGCKDKPRAPSKRMLGDAYAQYNCCAGQYKYCPPGTLRVCWNCQLVCVTP